MKRFVYPVFRNCEKLPGCEATGDKENPNKLAIDLKNAFHRGYVNWRGITPKKGTNPFLADYENILADCDDFRFNEPGIGNDGDSRKAESSKLGRCMAIGLLSDYYGYTWFANISNLKKAPEDGWTAKKKNAGDAPDMLIAGDNDFAVAEAKARQTPIIVNGAETKKWRDQVKNIIIEKEGAPVSFPTWLIATRYIVGDNADKPRMLIVDPPTQGRPINQEDFGSLVRWIAKSHIIANLSRLGMYDLILNILEPSATKRRTLIWKCSHPQLEHLQFIGRSWSMGLEKMMPFRFFGPVGDPEYLHFARFFFRNFYHDGFFDGMEVDNVRRLINGATPQALNTQEFNLSQYPFISILSDGSFIAPMNVMYLYNTIDL